MWTQNVRNFHMRLIYYFTSLLYFLLFHCSFYVMLWTKLLELLCCHNPGLGAAVRLRSNEGAVQLQFLFPRGATVLLGLGRPFVEVSKSHTDTLRLIGVLWTRNRPVAEVSTWRHKTFIRDRHLWPQRDSNPQSQQANGRRPTPQTAQPPGLA